MGVEDFTTTTTTTVLDSRNRSVGNGTAHTHHDSYVRTSRIVRFRHKRVYVGQSR